MLCVTRFTPPVSRSGERCSHTCVLQNGGKKQELGYSRTSSTLRGNRLLGGWLHWFFISSGFHFPWTFLSFLACNLFLYKRVWSPDMILPPHFVLLENNFRALFTHVGGRSGTFVCSVEASAPMTAAEQQLKGFGEEQRVEAISLVKNGYGMQLLSVLLCTIELYFFLSLHSL